MHPAVQTGSAELVRAPSLRVIECTAEPVSIGPHNIAILAVICNGTRLSVPFIFYMDCLQEQTLFCFSKAVEVLEFLNKTARDNKSIIRSLSVLVAAVSCCLLAKRALKLN